MDGLGKRFLLTMAWMFGGYGLVKLAMRAGEINLTGVAARLFNFIDGTILFGVKALAGVALFIIVFLAIASLLEARAATKKKTEEMQAKKIRDELAEKRLELGEKEERENEIKEVKKKKLQKLEVEQQRLAEIEHQKKRSAKEATQDSLSDFL